MRRAVFLAGGEGVTSLISMLSRMHATATLPEEVHFLFTAHVTSTQTVAHILGLGRLLAIRTACPDVIHLSLFFSGHPSRALMDMAVPRERFEPRRMLRGDVLDAFAIRNADAAIQSAAVCYICGPPQMTQYFMDVVREQVGTQADPVLYEKCECDWDAVLDAAYSESTMLSAG